MPKLYLTLVLIFCLHICAFSQSDSTRLTTIDAKLQKQNATHPAEKAYLQFNKPAYNTGDTIWFKGYVTVGAAHQPSALSGVLYVDLIDGKDNIIKTLQLKNDNGVSAGDFVVNEKVPPGNYRIRAYTAWMRNAGTEYFFNTTIPVGDMKTNAVFVNPSYTISTNANGEVINAKLAYTDKFGHPYSRREVTYEIKADSNTLYTGKGITDASGNLLFSFPGKTAPGQHITVSSHFKISGDIIINKITPINVANDNIDIQFFPEGGQLVNDVRSKVAFKAIGTNGLGADVKGVIIDNANNEVAYFQSQHAGMGVFAFTPQSGKTYTAKITLADNLMVTTRLPAIAAKGFVLAVNNNDSAKITIRVATNAATLQEKQGSAFSIVGQSGGVVYFTSAGKLDNASFNIVVPKNRFPAGIAQFTLFSAANEPLNERVAFIQNNTGLLNLNLSSPKTSYAAKEKVGLALAAKDNAGKPVSGNFSLTVFNDDITPVNENDENTILSNILLTSDLKGYIESPNYYFNKVSDQTRADLDMLMLTQGYRRFEWKEIMADKYPAITFKPERSLSLSGTLTVSGQPVAKAKVTSFSLLNNSSADTISNDQGKFTLAGINIIDTATLIIQARKEERTKDIKIVLDSKSTPAINKNTAGLENGFVPPVLNTANAADTVQLAVSIKNNKLKAARNIALDEVTVKARRNAGTELAPWMTTVTHSANLNGLGHADMVIGAKDIQDCFDLFTCMINKIPGILHSPDGNNMYFASNMGKSLSGGVNSPSTPSTGGASTGGVGNGASGSSNNTSGKGKSAPAPLPVSKPSIMFIQYMLDGVFTTPENLATVNPRDVETIEVLKSNSYLNVYGTQASGGLILITSRFGSLDPTENFANKVSPGVITTKFKGYYPSKAFYIPKYTPANINTADNRDAIYWNPNVTTNDNGTFPVEYFNSDIKGSYRAVIEGIDDDGNIGRFVYRYKVE